MHARLSQGPGDGKVFPLGDPPPQVAFLCGGGQQFPAEVHRYQLTKVNRTPPDPEATYQHQGRVTS